MSGGGAVPRAARVRFKPRAAAVFGAGYTFRAINVVGLALLMKESEKMYCEID